MSSPNDIAKGEYVIPGNTAPWVLNNANSVHAATIRIGKHELSEARIEELNQIAEFIERFTQENQQAREIWTAIKAKKRILG